MFLVTTKNIRKGERHLGKRTFIAVFFSRGGGDGQLLRSLQRARRLSSETVPQGATCFPFGFKKLFYQENFLFSCECEACEEEWPTYSKLPASPPSQKVADKLCEYEMDNMTAMERGEIDKALSFHCKEISLIQVKTTILVGLSGQKDKYIYDPTIFPEQPERAASIVGEREKELRVGLVAEGGRPHVRQRRPHRRHLSLRSTPGQSLGSSTTAQSISPYNVRARGSTLFWQNSIDPLLKKYIGFSFFVQLHGKQKQLFNLLLTFI